ncbi:hypothetical protein [Haliscomenobacter hydrossis]|uniref:Uncharacterized protein n=1 Tax=Haliscomenobacter hydrossis (strain ATCC 27775 / DSM 1100 / LMG 10767 / O) TaxID=760192 RepID=F4KV22_HALH1|nr:hypothetical protein [Haliscomenobacter hydrossis]AEE49188.1 hypothetical protein Halhy_1293 [Haliscomenobacter hydrossis DSM 1100]
MKNPALIIFLGLTLGGMPLFAQESYILKLQPQPGAEYHFQTMIKTQVNSSNGELSMSTQMEHGLSSQVKAVSDAAITLMEKIENIKGNAKSMGVDINFDTDKPTEGNPTMMGQLSQVVGKSVTSQIKPNGVFISGEPLGAGLIGGSDTGADFRTISGNARFPADSVKIGESWTVIDTIINQGMLTVATTIWTFKAIEDDLAVLVSSGQGTIAGSPLTAPEAKINGTLIAEGFSKVELKTGVAREAANKIKAQMEMDYQGNKQNMTSETESVSRMVK